MYCVVELQNDKGTLVDIPTVHDTYEDAASKFHQILMYAAKSGLTEHAAVILSSSGSMVASQCYLLHFPKQTFLA